MKYDGGKNGEGTYQRIINQIPPHRVYVELFAGSAAVLRKKRPAEVSVVCDLDPGAIAALREELTEGQHRELLQRLKDLEGAMVMLSGYWSRMYARELRDWRTDHFRVMTRQGPAVEWLWMNYAEPTELHDYRYLGDNFRQRERIRRQQRRWADRLARMDRLQRYALLSAIAGHLAATVDGGHPPPASEEPGIVAIAPRRKERGGRRPRQKRR